MGGLPWWLLKKKDIRLRENDPYFPTGSTNFRKPWPNRWRTSPSTREARSSWCRWRTNTAHIGEDKPYVANIRDMLRKNFGNDGYLYQCDWASNFTKNGLDDLIWTMNFRTGANIDQQFAKLKELRPEGLL